MASRGGGSRRIERDQLAKVGCRKARREAQVGRALLAVNVAHQLVDLSAGGARRLAEAVIHT